MENLKAVVEQLKQALTASSGKIDDAVLGIIYEHKLFKCLLPHEAGGLNMSFVNLMKLVEDCAAISGSLGWLMQIGNGGTYFYPLYEAHIAAQVFAPLNAVIAGSGAVSGVAHKVEGGYRVSGKWQWCSGADYASHFTANCSFGDQIIACTFLPHQVKVIKDWDSIGLKHTSTHTIQVEDIFVAEELTFKLDVMKQSHAVSAFSIPFILFAKLLTIKVQHGLMRALLSEATMQIETRVEKWPAMPDRISTIHHYLKQCVECVNEFAMLLSSGNNQIELNVYAEVAEQNTRLIRYAYELWHMCGMDVAYASNKLSQHFMDMMVAGQHSLLRNKYA